jgi:hypothetical protein
VAFSLSDAEALAFMVATAEDLNRKLKFDWSRMEFIET